MKRMINVLLDLVYPVPYHCVHCGKELGGWEVQKGLCQECLQELQLFSTEGLREVKGLVEQHFDHVQGVAFYQGHIKDWIYRMKYYGEREWIYPLVEMMVEHGVAGKWDGVVPIPLHESKLAQRGFNQALLLAQGLAFYLNVPCVDCLVRVKETLPQNRLKPEERKQNLQGVFSLKPDVQAAGKHWLIVDDIFTTGTTVNEAARVLKAAGSAEVGVYVLTSGRTM